MHQAAAEEDNSNATLAGSKCVGPATSTINFAPVKATAQDPSCQCGAAVSCPKDAKNVDELSKQLDAQLKIEDLIIKSREAEYAKWTPFTPLLTGGVGALLGFLTGLLGRKPNGSAEPPSD